MIIKAKKSLGQNFLINRDILEKIVNIIDITNKEILEIGPGSGNLTTYILKKKPKKFYVIEKDNNLSLLLKEKFNNEISIINDDVLKINENNISDKKLIVFGNLPYNISTEILSKWIVNLDNNFWFENLVLMFQKEVADRIIAEQNSKNYGRLSILTSWKMTVKKIIDVEPENFRPSPKVKSSLLVFEPKAEYFNLKCSNLEHVTNVFFNQRRKMIKKPLNILFKNFNDVANQLDLDLNLRPQNLSKEMFFKICELYDKLVN